MNKWIMMLALAFWMAPLARAEVHYNFPTNDTINITNEYESYFINLSSGIELTNHWDEWWAKNDIGFRYRFNGTIYEKWKADFNFNWTILDFIYCDNWDEVNEVCDEWANGVQLVGIDEIDNRFGTYKYGVNYTLITEQPAILVQWGIKNKGTETLENVWQIWRSKNIKIGDDYPNDFLQHNDNNTYLNLSQNILWNYNNPQDHYISIEDINHSAGLELWWDDNLNRDKIQAVSTGDNSDRNVSVAVKIGDIAPTDLVRQNWWWRDPPLCTGSCASTSIAKKCYNSSDGLEITCDAIVGDYLNISGKVTGSCSIAPSNCKLSWQDNTSQNSYTLVPTSYLDTEVYCQDSNCFEGDYNLNVEYFRPVNCSGDGEFSIRLIEELKSTTETFFMDCESDSTNPSISAENITGSDNIYINATIDDEGRASSFIDFNRSLFGYYAMDWSNSSGIHDNSSYNHHAVFKNGLGESDKIDFLLGDTLDLDGIDDRLLIDYEDDLNISKLDAFTIELWIYPYSSGSYYLIDYGHRRVIGSKLGVRIYTTATNRVYAQTGNGTEYSGQRYADININEWTKIDFVYYKGNNWSLYKNGVYVNNIITNVNQIGIGDYDIGIGAKRTGGLEFNGTIDEVRFHARSLDENELKASYYSDVNRKLFANFTGLQGALYNWSVCSIDASGNYLCENYNVSLIEEAAALLGSKLIQRPAYPLMLFMIMFLIVIRGKNGKKEQSQSMDYS